jgi:carbonic anhydrase
MLMGFISLMLLAFEDQITYICVAKMPLQWITPENPWATGPPCCTLGDRYWDDLPEQTGGAHGAHGDDVGGSHRRRMEVAFLRDVAQEAYSRRRLGSVNIHNTLLRESCPSSTYVNDVDTTGHPIMQPVPHPFDCPANGIILAGHPDGQYTRDNSDYDDAVVSSSFMDPQALHHVHTLIFLTACWHVFYTACIMVLAAWRIQYWAKWEYYGDDEDEDVSKLRSPMEIRNPVLEVVANFWHQFIKTVDPFTYIAIRRYYIVRNNMKWDFDFNTMCIQQQDRDFAHLVGIEPWMWLILVTQFILDGYTNSVFLKTLGTWLAVAMLLAVGTKLMQVFRQITYGVADAYDDERDGMVEKEDLERLQGEKVDPNQLNHLQPQFWRGNPRILLQILRYVMFQFSVVMAELTFYMWQLGGLHACYFQSRPIWPLMLCMVFLMMLHMGLITVPLYSLVSMTVHHSVHSTADLIKNFAVHKQLHMADLLKIKRQLGVARPHEEEVEQTGWKKARMAETVPERIPHDPEARAVHKAKRQIRGTFQWASHMMLLKAKIEKAEQELQTAQRLQAMSKEQKAAKIEAARAKATATKKSQIVPQPVDEVIGGHDSANLHHGSSKVELVHTTSEHGTERDVLVPKEFVHGHIESGHGSGDADENGHGHGDEHGHEDGNGHDHGHHGDHGPPWALLGHTSVLCVFAALLLTITSWWYLAGKYPGVHWSYEGANGPGWWGVVKPKYKMCMARPDAMQSPINFNRVKGPTLFDATINRFDLGANTREAKSSAQALYLSLNPLAASHNSSGSYFYPTQNHGSPRFDCGPSMTQAKKGECGYLIWQNGSTPSSSNFSLGDASRYNLREFHFHSPSEHSIDGQRYPLEMQVVFCTGACYLDKDYSGKAADSPDDLDQFAVYSVLFEAADNRTDGGALDTIWEYMSTDCPGARDKFGYGCPSPGEYCDDGQELECGRAAKLLMLSSLIKTSVGTSVDLHGAGPFVTYEGSITTPPCVENVRWFLQSETVKVPFDRIQGFVKHIKGPPGNARPLMERNGREMRMFDPSI